MPVVPSDDGLIIPTIKPHGKQKYHFVGNYLNAFTKAMREKWSELHYLDLFAGAGLARIDGTDEIVLGSPLLAASVKYPFTRLHVCEKNLQNVTALRSRLARAVPPGTAQVVCGDANERVEELLAEVPNRGTLSVTFADPFGLHLDFETVRRLADRRSDLIILLADNMDALRNWSAYYDKNPTSSLDRFMGEQGWREVLNACPPDKQAAALRDRYTSHLRDRLGYGYSAFERVKNTSGRDIYILLYASRSQAGVTIWNRVSKIEAGGQHRMFHDD